MRLASIALLTCAAAACGADDDGVTPPGEMSITLLNWMDEPVGGADVWTHDASGAQIAHTLTDTAGRATLLVTDGGAVTAGVEDVFAAGDWTTVLAVAPGDDLTMRFSQMIDREGSAPFSPTSAVLRFASAPPDTWAITVLGRCGDGWDTLEFDGSARIGVAYTCTAPTTLVVTALADIDQPLGYIVLRDFDLGVGGEVTIDQPWSMDGPTWSAELVGAPPEVTNVRVTRHVEWQRYGIGRLWGHFDSMTFENLAGSRTITAPRPDLDGDPGYTLRAGDSVGNRYTLETNEQPADRLTVDFGTLPSPRPVQLSDDTRRLTWAAVPDADLLELRLGIGQTYSNGQTSQTARWTVVSPPGATAFEFFPDVGFPFLDEDPFATDVFSFSVRAWRAPWWPAYEELRRGAELPAVPARFTTVSAYDGFTLDPLNP